MTRWAWGAVLGLAACGPAYLGPEYIRTDGCGASAWQGLLLQPSAAAAGITAPDGVRVILPGDGATRDWRPGRLNVEVDPLDRIVAIRCG